LVGIFYTAIKRGKEMKKFRFLMIFGICLVFCFLFTTYVYGEFKPYTPLPGLSKNQLSKPAPTLIPPPKGIPTVTLPISNLLEVRKDLIREEGNAFPGGWSKYYWDYKMKSGQELYGEEASPFDVVDVCPFTSEMWWVEALMLQDRNFETDEWAEEYYQEVNFPELLAFQIFLWSESLGLLAKDDLRFVYQDSTGMRKDGEIYHNELDETKKPIYYLVKIKLEVHFFSNPQDITWFSLHILNKNRAGRVDMRWDFRKDWRIIKKEEVHN
jgi:hypothetical protein